MKSCGSTRRSLIAYLERELEERSVQEVEGHLRVCHTCRGELEEIRWIAMLVRSLPAPSRPEEYWRHAFKDLRGKVQGLPRPARFPLLELFRGLVETPEQALVPVSLFLVALFNTLAILGLEEAFAFFSFYVLPFVLD